MVKIDNKTVYVLVIILLATTVMNLLKDALNGDKVSVGWMALIIVVVIYGFYKSYAGFKKW